MSADNEECSSGVGKGDQGQLVDVCFGASNKSYFFHDCTHNTCYINTDLPLMKELSRSAEH
jgi:hypothetical protein